MIIKNQFALFRMIVGEQWGGENCIRKRRVHKRCAVQNNRFQMNNQFRELYNNYNIMALYDAEQTIIDSKIKKRINLFSLSHF